MEKSNQSTLPAQAGHWGASLLFGAASAFTAVVAKIRNEFFEDVANTPEVKESRETIGTKIKELWDKAPTMTREDYFRDLRGYKEQMGREFNTIAEAHHYRSGGWRGITLGIFDRSNSMSVNSRRDVMVSAAVTAAVATGGALMFFGNRHSHKQINELKQRLDQQESAEKGRAA